MSRYVELSIFYCKIREKTIIYYKFFFFLTSSDSNSICISIALYNVKIAILTKKLKLNYYLKFKYFL